MSEQSKYRHSGVLDGVLALDLGYQDRLPRGADVEAFEELRTCQAAEGGRDQVGKGQNEPQEQTMKSWCSWEL